jgi:type IV pilus assembly protein PilB
MAQRLARKICTHCKVDYQPTDEELRDCGITKEEAAKINFKIGKGCVRCDNTGFSGRTGVFEILEVMPSIRKLIFEGQNQDIIREQALENGMRTLHDSAMEIMIQGVTSIREVIKLTIVD